MTKEHERPKISPLVHPHVVALAFIVIAYFLGRFVPLPFTPSAGWRNFGFLLTVIGFLLGVGALIEFRRARTTLDAHGSARKVVTSGIYRFTRNPIYLGFLFMVIGLPLNSGLIWGIILAPLYIIVMTRLVIEREEAYLEKRFEEQYTNYKSRVRRWL